MVELSHLTTDLVGRRYPEFKFQISSLWVQDYKEALGYSFEKVQDTSYVPSSFISCLRDGEFCIFSDLEIELSQLLHAGQSYQFIEALQVGDIIVSQSEISKVLAKNGTRGPMVFLDIKNTFRRLSRNGQQELEAVPVVEALMSVVVRPGPAA